jgi:hypothetical protein
MSEPDPGRPERPLADTVWWWTIVTLLVVYAVAWVDEQPGFAGVAVTHAGWTLVVVWPVVLGAGAVAGRSELDGRRRGWLAWVVAGVWTLLVGGFLAFSSGDPSCRDWQDPDCLADGTTRLAVAASIGLAWAAAEWIAITVRRLEQRGAEEPADG